nr:chloroplastic import inner membrane translocase subunit HP30-2-like [Ipomoea batatas]
MGCFSCLITGEPNLGITNKICNGEHYAQDDPFALSLAYVFEEMQNVTPTQAWYNYYSISPYPNNAIAYGHATCNTAISNNDCGLCLSSAKIYLSQNCYGSIGAQLSYVDCSMRARYRKKSTEKGFTTDSQMGEGKQGIMAVQLPSQNPIEQFQAKYNELASGVKAWLSKQSLPVEAAFVTAASAAQGGVIGAILGNLSPDLQPTPPPGVNLDPNAMATFNQAQALTGGPLVQARNFAVMTGVNAGISCVLKRVRGKEDVQSSMAAAFGSGVMYSLVSGMGGPDVVPAALTSGVFFALVQGGLFKLGQQFSQPPAEDTQYVKTRSLLSGLGLEKYEKNFKRGLLTDTTLPLLTDSALKDVSIPPGPRLLILDQVHSALNSLGLESFDAVTALAFCILLLFSVALRKLFIRIVNEVVCHADRSPSSSSWYKTVSSYDILLISGWACSEVATAPCQSIQKGFEPAFELRRRTTQEHRGGLKRMLVSFRRLPAGSVELLLGVARLFWQVLRSMVGALRNLFDGFFDQIHKVITWRMPEGRRSVPEPPGR